MTPNNNLSILPFYSDLMYQDHRKETAYGEIYKLYSPNSKLLSFQIIRDHVASTPVSSVLLQKVKGDGNPDGALIDITAHVIASGLEVEYFASDGYDIIKYPSTFLFGTYTMGLGQYYVVLSDGINTWYSDIFTITNHPEKLIRLTYKNYSNLGLKRGHIDYSDGFLNTCYLDAKIGKPRYPFEEEAKKRDGYTFIEKQISEKRYVFEFSAPEYLCDALRVVRMHDIIRIFYENEVYEVETIFIEPRWQAQGNIAIVTVEFGTGTIVKKTGGGYALNGGDFNNDFNDDFDNNT